MKLTPPSDSDTTTKLSDVVQQRPCSAFLELADAHELSALSHSDEGDKDSAKLDTSAD